MLRATLLITSLLGLAQAAPSTTVLKRDDPMAFTISSDRDGKCLSLPNGDATAPADGIALVALDCATASGWIIERGSGSVLLAANTGFALDAGENPGDHGGLKIWTSYPGLYQQTWYYTDDDRIAITGGTQCLDEGDNGPQTYTCQTGNGNQAWSTAEIEYCD